MQSIIAKVLTDEPRRVRSIRSTVPPHVEEAIHKALAKLPADRFSSAQQFADALTRPAAAAVAAEAAAPSKPIADAVQVIVEATTGWVRHNRVVVALGAAAALGFGSALWLWLRPPAESEAPVVRLDVRLPPGGRVGGWWELAVALAPDGKRLVFAADTGGRTYLFARALDELDARLIPGTQDARPTFFSPDGQWLGFWTPDMRLKKVPVAGGPPVTIADLPGPIVLGASWGPDDVILFSQAGSLWRVTATGDAKPEMVARRDSASGVDLRWPDLLPGGKVALVALHSVGEATLGVVSLATGEVTRLGLPGTNPRYLTSGHVVYGTADQTLLAVPFDLKRLRVTGPPVPVAEGIAVTPQNVTQFAVSQAGTLAYVRGSPAMNRLVMVDRRGVVTPLTSEVRNYISPRVSPDGRRVATQIATRDSNDIWLYSASSETLSRLSFGGRGWRPAWSPDGSRVAFISGSGRGAARALPADGSGDVEVFVETEHEMWEIAWLPNGRGLVFRVNHPETKRDLWFLPLDGDRTPQPLVASPFEETSPAISPDSRWLAYVSDESGRSEVYVRPLLGGGRWQVSSEGGSEPVWNRSGRELFYRTATATVVARIRTVPNFAVEGREVLFAERFVRDPVHSSWDVFPDGQRFVTVASAQETEQELVVVVNWAAELRRWAAAGRK